MRISDWSSDVCSSDLLDTADREERLGEAAKRDDVVAISALTGEGVEALLETIGALLTSGHRRYRIALDPADGAGAAWLHQHGEVLDHTLEGDTLVVEMRLAPADYERFETRRSEERHVGKGGCSTYRSGGS